MIGRLRGLLVKKDLERVLVEVGGVGFDVQISLQTYNGLPEEGQEAVLHIHTHLREDAILLLGFFSLEEREIFRLLLQVNGIGPKVALNILSGIGPLELIDMVKRSNLAGLTTIPGIGKRMAERIVVELRDKMIDLTLGVEPTEVSKEEKTKALLDDLGSALANMGYKAAQLEKLIPLLKPEAEAGTSLGEMVRLALQKMRK